MSNDLKSHKLSSHFDLNVLIGVEPKVVVHDLIIALSVTDSWFAGYWEEEHSYSRRSWQRYQREVLHELSCRDEEDDDDEDGDKYDSD